MNPVILASGSSLSTLEIVFGIVAGLGVLVSIALGIVNLCLYFRRSMVDIVLSLHFNYQHSVRNERGEVVAVADNVCVMTPVDGDLSRIHDLGKLLVGIRVINKSHFALTITGWGFRRADSSGNLIIEPAIMFGRETLPKRLDPRTRTALYTPFEKLWPVVHDLGDTFVETECGETFEASTVQLKASLKELSKRFGV